MWKQLSLMDQGQSDGTLNFVKYKADQQHYSSLQYYIVHLPDPLQPGAQQTISISYHVLSALSPLPASINQNEKQYLTYDLSAYATTAYSTTKQSTKVKLSTTDIPSWTSTEGLKSSKDPERQGSTITYGPYDSAPVEPDTIYPVSIRYEFTKPVLKATKLERDIEVSHWGGNLATEERFWLENIGATLKDSFNRVAWAGRQYYMPQGSSALVELKLPLQPGSVDAYFTDDIGNVSTSHFRPTPSKSSKEALLELKPRYPVFGGWKYSFRAGWNNQLAPFLRKLSGSASSNGDSYVLRVPFIEGPKMAEGLQYEDVTVRIILPEGATDVKYELISTQVGMPSEVTEELSLHKTFMDTVGRTVLTLKAKNVVDDARDGEIIVSLSSFSRIAYQANIFKQVTYNYSSTAMLRKPVTITASLAALFIVLYTISQLDVSIGKKKLA